MDTRVVVRPARGAPMTWGTSLYLLIPVVIGLVMLGIAVWSVRLERAYEREGVQALASVTNRWISSTSDSTDQYHVRYQFTTSGGARFTGSDTIPAQVYARTRIGDSITVTYLASDPWTSRAADPGPAIFLYLLGAAGILAAVGGAWALCDNTVRLLRGSRGGAPTAQVEVRSGVTYVFRRPAVRVIVDLLGAPLGAAMFLGGVWVISIANLPHADPLTRTVIFIGFGFFGVMLLTGVPYGLRRGLRPAVLEIGPGGIWMPETGQLAWSEVAEVRAGPVTGFGGDEGPATYQRLAIVPGDPTRAERARQSPAWRMVRAFTAFARRLRPGATVPDLDAMPPFGVYDYDLGGSIDTALAAASLYRVVQTGESRPPPTP